MAPMTVADFEAAAAGLLPSASVAFVNGAAGDGYTAGANRTAFDRLELLPRIMVDVSQRSTATTVLGQSVSMPILIAPSAMHRVAHVDGETATVRAAGRVGTIMVLSVGSSVPVEVVADAAMGPVWFQTYVGRDRGLTAEVIRRAESAGCTALVVTVDAPVVGGRTAELNSGFTVRPEWFVPGHTPMYGMAAPVAAGRRATELWDSSLSWADVAWLREITGLPLVLKGVLRPDDAARAVAEGLDCVIVSNHGGRQLDGAVPSMSALPAVVAAVGGQIEVLVDGGIRRGSDVLKAIALGARAVLVGRPVLWGLAVDGDRGVEHVLELLSAELDLAMALCGAPDVAAISGDLVAQAAGSAPSGHGHATEEDG